MKKQLPNIKVTVKTVPHPNPQQAIDVIARLVLKDILAEEARTS